MPGLLIAGRVLRVLQFAIAALIFFLWIWLRSVEHPLSDPDSIYRMSEKNPKGVDRPSRNLANLSVTFAITGAISLFAVSVCNIFYGSRFHYNRHSPKLHLHRLTADIWTISCLLISFITALYNPYGPVDLDYRRFKHSADLGRVYFTASSSVLGAIIMLLFSSSLIVTEVLKCKQADRPVVSIRRPDSHTM